MKQFTEQDMIDFAEWLGQNWEKDHWEKDGWFSLNTQTYFTTSEVLDIFINKDNK
jgi:hypothetical protein